MAQSKRLLKILVGTCLLQLTLGAVLVPSFAQETSRTASSLISSRSSAKRVVFVPPPGEGAPKRTVGGASRGVCTAGTANPQILNSNNSEPAEAIRETPSFSGPVPLSPVDERGKGLLGLTTEDYPTFFAYVPETSAREAFFSIKDETGTYHYEKTVALPADPGVLKISLPEASGKALQLNQDYSWYLELKCDGQHRPSLPRAEGLVRRVTPNGALHTQLNSATPLEQAVLYGQNGIWYDTLDKLSVSVTVGAVPVSQWSDLLASVGLDEVSEEPLAR